MLERFRQGRLTWINLKNPTTEEAQIAMNELSIPPTLLTDVTSTVPKNTVVRIGDTIKLTLDFPAIKRLEAERQFEVKFFISKHSLLTVQYEEMEGIDRFKRQFEVAIALRKSQRGITGAHLFFSLFNNLYDAAHSKLDYIETKLSEIESEIFKNNEKHMVFEIAGVSKRLIAFRHTIQGHSGIFHDLTTHFDDMFEGAFEKELHIIRNQYFQLEHKSNMQFETLDALRETNSAMLFTKQNEVTKLFTIIAFITFPLTLLSSLFGMNTHSTPIIGHPFDFWIIVSVMLIITITFFIYFKHKDWI